MRKTNEFFFGYFNLNMTIEKTTAFTSQHALTSLGRWKLDCKAVKDDICLWETDN